MVCVDLALEELGLIDLSYVQFANYHFNLVTLVPDLLNFMLIFTPLP